MDEKILRRFAPTLYDQLVIVVSRGDSWSGGQRGQILIGGTVFVGGGDANPLGHYEKSTEIPLKNEKFCLVLD